ncbi:hypothetical protein NDU88_005511 [Pleurodeles waltl]|uniref:Uncharacterized protein n=1 Tax=Pleurodeles waltl TaxID=8319 RepID=A0AAV7MYP0_PLEWA|nr:hypothetical protein NDU88_005511 [Pleurodeles waltl]
MRYKICHKWVCAGPTLPRSDPSYPWGTGTVEIPDPDVFQLGTNQRGLPGEGRQQQALRAVTRIKKEGGEEFEREQGGNGREDHGSEVDIEGGEDLRGGSGRDSRRSLSCSFAVVSKGDTGTTTGTARRSRGPGGSIPELRPQSGDSGLSRCLGQVSPVVGRWRGKKGGGSKTE